MKNLRLIPLLLMLLPLESLAERSSTFDNYIVHYNAFRSDTIPAAVARQHSIIRSDHRGVVNITVLKKQSDGSTTPVAAKVWGYQRNLADQRSELEFFPVKEQKTIYYLDQFRIDDHDTLRFTVYIEPEGAEAGVQGTVKFVQNFYTD